VQQLEDLPLARSLCRLASRSRAPVQLQKE
jgi:hypothetical protein